jgi:hypothetical protein
MAWSRSLAQRTHQRLLRENIVFDRRTRLLPIQISRLPSLCINKQVINFCCLECLNYVRRVGALTLDQGIVPGHLIDTDTSRNRSAAEFEETQIRSVTLPN